MEATKLVAGESLITIIETGEMLSVMCDMNKDGKFFGCYDDNYTLAYTIDVAEEGVVWKNVPLSKGDYMEDSIVSCVGNPSEWSDKHYDHYYTLTEDDIKLGKVRLDVYTVANVWGIGGKDNSGALWHTFKIFPRFGEKNSEEREIIAMYKQVKALAKVKGVSLEGV